MLELAAVWAPLYGKINVVSELDVNLQAYVMLGVGVNGTRTVQADLDPTNPNGSGYRLSGHQFGDGGPLSGLEPNVTAGFGMQIFLLDWLSLRGEARGILFRDEFDFDQTDEPIGYTSQYWFFQGGLGFTLF